MVQCKPPFLFEWLCEKVENACDYLYSLKEIPLGIDECMV
jgi:hypothetical protein